MIIDGDKVNAFTNLSEDMCIKVIDILQKEYGEIGHFRIEGNEVSFQVYKWCYEEAQHIIKSDNNKIKLNLIDKFDDPFYSLSYRII
jgi:hypothetical protein